MKKVVTLILTLIIAFTLALSLNVSIVKAAQGDNLVLNPGFEDGLDKWKTQSAPTLDEMGDQHSGMFGCKVTKRSAAWASPMQDLTDAMKKWGPGDYDVSVWVKIDGTAVTTDNMTLVFNVTYDDTHQWLSNVKGDINNKGFVQLSGVITVPYKVQLGNIIVYLQSSSGTTYDYHCDDFLVAKSNGLKEPIAEPTPPPLQKVESRPDKPLVGAIRWDAWHNPLTKWNNQTPDKYIGAQMVGALSPSQFHFRLPFFGKVESATKVNLPDYTQEIFDQEMLYAKEAGINYFTYCWYADDDIMSTARKLHTTSKYKEDVKLTGMWDITNIPAAQRDTYINMLKESYYQKVDNGRPLVYVNNGEKQTAMGIQIFRNKCIAAGLKNPYLVALHDYSLDQAVASGVDALSHYAMGGGISGGQAYSELAKFTKNKWAEETKESKIPYIPCVPSGWDRRPRMDPPMSWEQPTKDKTAYFQTASAQEIAQLLQDAIDFNNAHKDLANINSVMFYAWNEHDEGGWLCPTKLDDDGDGIVTKRADGTDARDTRRLQAIQKVLKPDAAWTLDKDVDLSTVWPSPAPTVTKAVPGATPVRDTEKPLVTEEPTISTGNGTPWGLIGGGAGAVVAVAAAAFVLISRNKKKSAAPIEETPTDTPPTE